MVWYKKRYCGEKMGDVSEETERGEGDVTQVEGERWLGLPVAGEEGILGDEVCINQGPPGQVHK